MKGKQPLAELERGNIMLLYHEIFVNSNKLAHVFELLKFFKLLWENTDNLMKILIAFVPFSFLSTILKNIHKNSISIQLLMQELLRAIMIFMLVAISCIIDFQLIDAQGRLKSITTLYYVGHEGLIVLKNAVEIGVPVPQFLKNFLIKLRDKADTDGNTF